MCTRAGTRPALAASRPSVPALAVWVCTTWGRNRRMAAMSAASARRSSAGRTARPSAGMRVTGRRGPQVDVVGLVRSRPAGEQPLVEAFGVEPAHQCGDLQRGPADVHPRDDSYHPDARGAEVPGVTACDRHKKYTKPRHSEIEQNAECAPYVIEGRGPPATQSELTRPGRDRSDRVCLMIGQLGLGGAEKQVALLARELNERGIRTDLLVMFERGRAKRSSRAPG